MVKRRWLTLLALPAVVSGLIVGATPATASTGTSITRAESSITAPIVGNGYVIVNPASAVAAKGATFYPTGPISSNTLVVIANPDGTLPGGITTVGLMSLVAQIKAAPSNTTAAVTVAPASVASGAAAAKPDATSIAATTSYAWSATSGGYGGWSTGASILGYNWSAQARYNFYTAAGFNQGVAGEGIGHYQGYNGSTFGVWTVAYGVGSGSSGGAFVPWGEVLDNERFRGWCTISTICWGNYTD